MSISYDIRRATPDDIPALIELRAHLLDAGGAPYTPAVHPQTLSVGAGPSRALPVTRGVIEALRDEPDRDVLSERLASDVALSRVVEQALLLQRLLLTGLKEPNVAANEIATRTLRTEQET